ncbi:MAG: DUF4062 domain-containing protein [Anaerolineales bacterium]|nr:MAG: DUF4062 domain-containing protein [Anaerolineales bacterium]
MVGEDRRYEIFISSTSKDLQKVRELLIQTTVQCGHFPSAMELFIAAGAKDLEHIEDCIRKADLFVILIGARYGTVVKDLGKTYTRLEYDLAIEHKKPILAFLLNDKEYAEERGKLAEGDPERKHDDDLREFRELVKQHPEGFGRIVKFFGLEAIDKLAATYELELQDAIRRLGGKGGWIRGELYDVLKTRVSLSAIVGDNPFFKRFVDRLNAFDVLSMRTISKVPHLKRAIADYFLDQYLGRMIESGVRNLFFESGSSIAFLSEAFIERLREDWMLEVYRDLNIQTNNILTHLDFVLSEYIRIEMYPYGPPEAKYGATFGPLTTIPRREPPTRPRLLSKKAREVVGEIRARLTKRYKDHGVILMTASGIELSEESGFPARTWAATTTSSLRERSWNPPARLSYSSTRPRCRQKNRSRLANAFPCATKK